MLTIDMVRAGARWHRPRVAVRAGGQSVTFGAVDELSSRLAHVLLGLGVIPGQRLGVLLGNGLHTVTMDFACLKARATRVPLSARLSAAEQARMLADAGVRLLVTEPALAPRAAELTALVDGLTVLAMGVNDENWLDLLAAAETASASDPGLPARPDDVILALYTSGTTGTLKAAQHTLANLVNPGPEDVMLHAAPLIHASGTFVLPFWLRGGAAAVLPGFEPQAYLDALVTTGATHANLVPTMLGMLLAAGAEPRHAAGLRSVIYGASPMPRPTIEAALELWGPVFTQYYGQTEAPLALAVLRPEDHVGADAPLASCGRPSVDAELRLVDAAGEDVPPGEPGEIAVRGPMTMAGYLGAPDLDSATFLGEGWLRTRDVGRFDDRGFLHLLDRTSDMIVTGGYNVYPREVEDALLTHPAVAEAAVVGGPDPVWVEAVVAFVALYPDVHFETGELLADLRGRLAGYKVPKRVEVVAAIPKSPVGKVLRRALRDPLWEGTEQAGR
ncbi:MAG: class I adenylate-forming enzyme family protein [Mycobacteriales bacterium]